MLRAWVSPVPTHTTAGSLSATALNPLVEGFAARSTAVLPPLQTDELQVDVTPETSAASVAPVRAEEWAKVLERAERG